MIPAVAVTEAADLALSHIPSWPHPISSRATLLSIWPLVQPSVLPPKLGQELLRKLTAIYHTNNVGQQWRFKQQPQQPQDPLQCWIPIHNTVLILVKTWPEPQLFETKVLWSQGTWPNHYNLAHHSKHEGFNFHQTAQLIAAIASLNISQTVLLWHNVATINPHMDTMKQHNETIYLLDTKG